MHRLVRPRKCWNEEGVASTVGTIMALLVFLTFLSLITNQYVPVWMKDSEAAHMGEALGQFGNFKSDIDTQVLGAQVAQQMNRHFIPYTSFASVKLGVDGVPIFSSPTTGELRIDQSGGPWSVWFRYSISGNNTTVPEAVSCVDPSNPAAPVGCGGFVELHTYNKYFPQQTVAYENGALIRSQFDGELIKAEPSFQVLRTTTSAQVDFTIIQLFGSGGVSGIGAESLSARVVAADQQEYANLQTDAWINHTTMWGPAWYQFFNGTLADAYNVTSANYEDNPTDFHYTQVFQSGKTIQLRADNPIYLVQAYWNNTASVYNVIVEFKKDKSGDSVNVLPISAFRILHAYANVAAGEQGNEVGI